MSAADLNETHAEAATPPRIKVAAIQLNTGSDPVRNRDEATALIREAAAQGATFIVTPEYSNVLLHAEKDALVLVQPDDDSNDDIRHYRALAQELGITLNIGSLAIKLSEDKMANRSFMIDPKGEIVARYDKIHMFDVKLPDGQSFQESETVQPGTEAVVVEMPFGKVGMNICYDLRFPEQQKAEMMEGGATILTLPAAYSVASGQRTWETFLRARAAETGCYIIAPAQCGTYENGTGRCWGHSMIVNPWGTIDAQAADPDKPGIVYATLDPAEIRAAREAYPVVAQTLAFKFNVQSVPAKTVNSPPAATKSAALATGPTPPRHF